MNKILKVLLGFYQHLLQRFSSNEFGRFFCLIICLNLAQRSSLKSDHHHELFNQHMSQSLVLIGPGGGAWVPLSGFNDPFGHRVDTEAILNG